MTERHHYKYVVLDSSKENGNAVQAKFNVQIPHGITNASRVCVKSFSMPNVIHNVYGDFKTVRFVEFSRKSYYPVFPMKKFYTSREKISHGPRPDDCWLDDPMQVGKNSQKFTEGGPTPDDAGALLFQKCRRVSGRVGRIRNDTI